ncbi:MAG: putative alanine aminopeptidase [Frankiales bacterium]|nr:putative alanine aminopeptidase [Frankiales bacterium]
MSCLLMVAACSSPAAPLSLPASPSSGTPTSSTAAPQPGTATRAPVVSADCSSYRAPDPHRPVLTADVTVTGRSVTGTERVVFTPDRTVTELVFRLWASSPRPRAAGGSSTLTSVAVDGATRTFSRPVPTLVRIPWRGVIGRPVTIDLGFGLVLPRGADDRFGNRGTTSWFASGMPLLAWERGRGWATEPATSAFAEASTSEEMRLARLTIHHAAGLTAVATGSVVSEDATTTVTSAPTIRDVAVAVGAFRTVTLPGPVPVLVAVAPQVKDDPKVVAREVVRATRVHVARFGPFPYGRLVVAVLPDIHGGIEYPGAILLGTGQDKDATVSHEVAHQWFYGLVGDDQARDPWLDEAFATYAEALDRGTGDRYRSAVVPVDGVGRAGRPMTYWEGRRSYFRSVYVQGAAALLRARAAAPAAFDSQVRCYVARSAHRIATPADVASAMPLAVPALRRAGAL